MTLYRRRPSSLADDLTALAAGAVAGLVTGLMAFYMARNWLLREPLDAGRPDPADSSGDGGENAGRR